MKKQLLCLVPALVVAIALAGSAASRAQQPTGPPEGVFAETLDVRVVNIEVVVTDRKGVSVFGLRAEDFKLTVDGEEFPIDYFTEVRGGVGMEPRDEGVGATVAGIPGIEPGRPVGTSYLLFIDEVFTLAGHRDHVLESVIDNLGRLQPEDRMAVVAFDGARLDMLSTWSSSASNLSRVLKRAQLRPTHGLDRMAERRRYDRDTVETLEPFFGTELDQVERDHIERLVGQVESVTRAAAATLRSFARPPGRKVMLVLSGGWPLSPADYLIATTERQVLEVDLDEGRTLLRRLTDVANLVGYTLYPVDVPGMSFLAKDASVVEESRFLMPLDREVGAQGATGPRSQLRENQIHAGLQYLAGQTGGLVFLDEKRALAFETVAEDTRSYYWLGFAPEREWDDRAHELRVEVRGSGLTARARSGFLDSSRQADVRMAVESALLFGSPSGHEGLKLEVGEFRRTDRGRMETPLIVWIPLAEMDFLPAGNQQVARLELRIAVSDESGQNRVVPPIPLAFGADQQLERGKYVRYETTLELRREAHRAVVAVSDPVSGRMFSAAIDIQP